MSGRLPEWVDPLQLVEKRVKLEGACEADSLRRLAEMLFGPSGDIAVRLDFHYDEANRAVVTGRIKAALVLQCQRCLEPVTIELDIRPHLGICASEAEAERLPAGLEPLMFDGEPLSVGEMVEDEMILALPIIPRHPQSCGSVPTGRDDGRRGAPDETHRPFRDLKDMLGKR